MIDHCSFAVLDYGKSLHFYDTTLAILGYERLLTVDDEANKRVFAEYGSRAEYARNNAVGFCISKFGNHHESIGSARGVHVAFAAPSLEAINQWHAMCIMLGATDNGQPGPRPEYHSGYYGAFVIDPNGWRIEACLNTYQKI